MTSTNKDFVRTRICNFAGKEFDPSSDKQVEDILRSKFNILLPQRKSLNDSLAATKSNHEIITLILEYRAMN